MNGTDFGAVIVWIPNADNSLSRTQYLAVPVIFGASEHLNFPSPSSNQKTGPNDNANAIGAGRFSLLK